MRVLANKVLHFVSLTDSFITLDAKLLNTLGHKGHYASSHNIFRIIKYAFQIMHNTFQIPRNIPNSSKHILNSLQIPESSQHISKSSQHISKSSQHISKSSQHISKSSQHIRPSTPSVGREKGTVTQLLLLLLFHVWTTATRKFCFLSEMWVEACRKCRPRKLRR